VGAAATLLLSGCGGGSGTARSGSDADRRHVAVLARHVRHQGELAAAATARLPMVDAEAAAVAKQLSADATAQADALEGLLRSWGVDSTAEADLFAGAVGVGSVAPGTIVYGCSLAGLLDDVSQVQQVEPARLALRFSQLVMTSAVEARQLAETDRVNVSTTTTERVAPIDRWEQDVLVSVAPWLPATDRAYAERGGEPERP
jgi:hypothetical protein